MKRLLLLAALWLPLVARAQYTSPTFQNLTVLGAFNWSGQISPSSLAAQAANTVLANFTASSASPAAFAVPGCSTSSSALSYTSGTGLGCNTSINAATFGGAAPSAYQAALGFTPVQQGGGAGQLGNKVYIGWSGAKLKAQVDSTDQGNIALESYVIAHDPCPSIMDYGGVNNGTGDNRTAFANAAAASPSGQACVYFPPGSYAFGGNLSYTLTNGASIAVLGAGMGVSKLQWAAGGGMTINFSNNQNFANLANLSITTGTTATGTGLLFNETGSSGNALTALSTIQNVSINGSDGVGQVDYWATAFKDQGVSSINFINFNVFGPGGSYTTVGTGIDMEGTNSANQAVELNFWGGVVNYVGTGMLYGNFVQGVTVTNSNFTGDNIGITTTATNDAQSGLTVIGSQFNCLQYAIYDQTTIGIAGLLINNNYFELPYNGGSSVVAILLNKVYQAEIEGNIIERVGPSASGLNGIVIGGASTIGAMISGNNIFAVTTGIWLQTGSTNINVQSNFYNSNGNNVVNSCSSGCTVGGGSQ